MPMQVVSILTFPITAWPRAMRVRLLGEGKIVVLPTETVYGAGRFAE